MEGAFFIANLCLFYNVLHVVLLTGFVNEAVTNPEILFVLFFISDKVWGLKPDGH